jgi:hypothetical protein
MAAVDLDLQHRLAGELLDGDTSAAPGTCFIDGLDLGGLLPQDVEVVAEELDAEVGSDAGDHLVHAHLDGLREAIRMPGMPSRAPAMALHELVLGGGARHRSRA